MSDEELKKQLKKAILIKAPEGFTDKIMEGIALEKEDIVAKSPYKIPGKMLLILLAILFSGSIILGLLVPSEDLGIMNNINDYISLDLPKYEYKGLIINKVTAYVLAALFIFLYMDYKFVVKRRQGLS